MTKTITIISDTHMSHEDLELPGGDLLLHCGDYSATGRLQEITEVNRWFGTLDYQDIVVISGNHDAFSENAYSTTKQLFSNARYIQDELIEIQGLKIWGSPWSKTYGHWSWMKPEDKLKELYDKIPKGIDILMSHQPPYGKLDKVPNYGNQGSKVLRDTVRDKIKPRLHCFGHLHLDGGKRRDDNGIIYINGAVLDEDYMPKNSIITIAL